MSDRVSPTPHTSYSGSVINAARTLEFYGIDARATLADAGIDMDATPAFDARVPTSVLHNALISHAGREIDPLIGLKYAELMHPAGYHAFGVMLTSSTTLRAFCHRVCRYWAYINTGDEVFFNERGELAYRPCVVSELSEEPYESLIHGSAWAATIVKLLRLGARPDYAPKKIMLAFATPQGYEDQYSAFFRCPIEYDADTTTLCFDVDDLDEALPGGNAQLARHSECLVYKYVKDFVEFSVINRARMVLFELLPRGNFALDTLAESMETGQQQLAQDLKDAGTTYQQLLSDTRQELAEEYIERADLTINEIAYMLGFSDCSNFARSFRRWTGMSPSDYRSRNRIG